MRTADGGADLVAAVLDEERALLRALALWAGASVAAGLAVAALRRGTGPGPAGDGGPTQIAAGIGPQDRTGEGQHPPVPGGLLAAAAHGFDAGASMRTTSGSTVGDVARQALGWGLVDLAIVGWGLRGLRRARRTGLTPDAARARARRMARVTGVNAVLDVGYVASGVALAARAPRRRGDGLGIAVQGLALLWLDVRHASAFRRLTSAVPGSGPGGPT
ncbi:hypothetical protein [Kineosporia sp. R_H_3]|uniref:DUF6992 family protein n=1 Tax=Kineosporia sp. R_H_3 TaxID=1961848 RepID=UPI000B4C1A0E|nr:hypothetical protein [Kineosporia sp. R_H_3]